jgi:hypothetical protein
VPDGSLFIPDGNFKFISETFQDKLRKENGPKAEPIFKKEKSQKKLHFGTSHFALCSKEIKAKWLLSRETARN